MKLKLTKHIRAVALTHTLGIAEYFTLQILIMSKSPIEWHHFSHSKLNKVTVLRIVVSLRVRNVLSVA